MSIDEEAEQRFREGYDRLTAHALRIAFLEGQQERDMEILAEMLRETKKKKNEQFNTTIVGEYDTDNAEHEQDNTGKNCGDSNRR